MSWSTAPLGRGARWQRVVASRGLTPADRAGRRQRADRSQQGMRPVNPEVTLAVANYSQHLQAALAILTVIPAPFCCQPVVPGASAGWGFRVGGGGRSVFSAGPGSG
jgi:hypothetical protein